FAEKLAVDHRKVDDALWAQVRAQFSEAGGIELGAHTTLDLGFGRVAGSGGMPAGPRLVIVFVVAGLRPDSITREDTPTLFRLRAEGVSFASSHAVFPTVTRVNAAALSTGAQPGTNGLLGNQLYVPTVDRGRALDSGDYRNLLALERASSARLLLPPPLAERLHRRGLRLAGVSSGSTGSAFLLNPRAP